MICTPRFYEKLRPYATWGGLLKLPLLLPAFLVVVLLILFRPFIIIQIYRVYDWRFGHFVLSSHMMRLETLEWNNSHKKKKIIIYYFPSKVSSNDYFKQNLKNRHVSIQNNFGFVTFTFCNFFRFLIATTDDLAVDIDGLSLKHPPQISFSRNEIAIGTKFLDQFGLNLNDKFVCLNVRDNEYAGEVRGRKFYRHANRNSKIHSYVEAAETLANLGYTVFRMGALLSEPLISHNPRVIDYATNGMRSEFLDLFLGAHCKFAVLTNAGWANVPRIFKRPILFVNSVPVVESRNITSPAIFYPKRVIEISSGKMLSIKELCDRDLLCASHVSQFANQGYRFEDLSHEDLTKAVTEMVARVEMQFVPTDQEKLLQEKLNSELTNNPCIQPTPGYYPVRAKYAACFLVKYPKFLD